jgi:putative sigma-54 modulation protein
MAIEITARHMNATAEVQRYAQSKAGTIMEDFPKVEHVHMVLDVEKHRNIVGVFVQAKKHLRLEAQEASDKMVTAIDLATEKIRKQLGRVRDKVHDHKQAMKRMETDKARGVPFESELEERSGSKGARE